MLAALYTTEEQIRCIFDNIFKNDFHHSSINSFVVGAH